MSPDFSKNTVKTLAERAAYICSNPDCRARTVGPNSDPKKAIIVGEAAHICGARENAKRFVPEMHDMARAEITNGIWLCRNCHKLIDTDERKYSCDLLYAWREQHEKYVLSELGNQSDKIENTQREYKLKIFENYPPIIRRILIDKPVGWEWRLTAELMRYFNNPLFRRLDDLRSGAYVKPITHLTEENTPDWIIEKLSEATLISSPAKALMQQLTASWGPHGVEGDELEIHHVCQLIQEYIEQTIQYEEKLYFANAPEQYRTLISLLKDRVGSQVQKLADIPNKLDAVVELIGTDHGGTETSPHVVNEIIVFDLPKGWASKFNKELRRVMKSHEHNTKDQNSESATAYLIAAVILLLLFALF